MDWSQTAAAGASAAGGLLSNIATGLFNANQSKINRNFQREMYQRQYDDSVAFWNMQNQYNLPSAQLQRLKDANLNPLLMYGQGGVQNVAQSQPNQPQKPSGAQSSAAFSNPLDLAQYALLDAEKEKKKAETEKLHSETDWQNLELQYGRDTYNIRYAIAHHNDEMLQVQMDEMRNNIVNSSMITSQQVQTMMQARQYEIKRFNLDETFYGGKLAQGWQQLANDRERIKIEWSSIGALWQRVRNETKITDWQVGRIAFDIMWDNKFNPLKMKSMSLDNLLKRWDSHLKKATLSQKQAELVNQNLKNWYYGRYGSENPFEFKYLKDIRSFSNMLDASFVLPFNR